MIIKEMKFKNESFTGYLIEMPNAPLIMVKAKNGFIMCGYLDIATSGKLGDCACVVRGVSSLKEILKKEVTDLTKAARVKKIKKGMTGLQALLRMSK